MKPAVFLDRDHTLIAAADDTAGAGRVRLLDGVAAGLRELHDAGYQLVVVTNQPGVALGQFTEADVDAVHQRIAAELEQQTERRGIISRFYYCPYDPAASVEEYRRDHPWRKPHPGMILQAARDLEIDLGRSWMIGDRPRDVRAGRAAGCRTVLLSGDSQAIEDARPTTAAESFTDAVRKVIQHDTREAGATAPSRSARRRAAVQQERQERAVATVETLPAEAPRTHKPRLERQPAKQRDDETIVGEIGRLRRVILDLTEEIRADRVQRREFTPMTLLAGLTQLIALLLLLLGLLYLTDTTVFFMWLAGAMLAQLAVITILLADRR